MFDDFDTQIQIEEVVRDDMVLIEPEDYYRFLRLKGIDVSQNDIIDFS